MCLETSVWHVSLRWRLGKWVHKAEWSAGHHGGTGHFKTQITCVFKSSVDRAIKWKGTFSANVLNGCKRNWPWQLDRLKDCTWTESFQLFKLDLDKVEEQAQIVNIHWLIEKAREFQKNIYFCFIDYVKAFDCVDNNKLWKILKEMGIPDHLTCLLRNLYAGQEATVRTGHGTTDWFQIGKGVREGCLLSPCYLTYMQGTSWETLGWMKHKLESRLPGEIWITSDMQMTPHLGQKAKKNWRASWWKWKRRVKKLA